MRAMEIGSNVGIVFESMGNQDVLADMELITYAKVEEFSIEADVVIVVAHHIVKTTISCEFTHRREQGLVGAENSSERPGLMKVHGVASHHESATALLHGF